RSLGPGRGSRVRVLGTGVVGEQAKLPDVHGTVPPVAACDGWVASTAGLPVCRARRSRLPEGGRWSGSAPYTSIGLITQGRSWAGAEQQTIRQHAATRGAIAEA